MKVLWIGWCNDPVDNHDKVWGICIQGKSADGFFNRYAIFWGRRGKKLQQQTKELGATEVHSLIRSKENKGYVAVPPDEVNKVYDTFAKDLFKVAMKA